jgi:hypothetical protein
MIPTRRAAWAHRGYRISDRIMPWEDKAMKLIRRGRIIIQGTRSRL